MRGGTVGGSGDDEQVVPGAVLGRKTWEPRVDAESCGPVSLVKIAMQTLPARNPMPPQS